MPNARVAAPPVAWTWSRFGYGVALGVPAALVTAIEPALGLGAAVGMLPAAAAGLAPARSGRRMSVVLSIVAAASLGVGSVLGQNALLAVTGLFLLGVGAAVAAARARAGRLALFLAYPLVGIGLSFEPGDVVAIAGVMILSGLYAWLVSLLWPEWPVPPRQDDAPAPLRSGTLAFGIALGLAGAVAAAIGFAFELDHKGWLCGATLMVMRPAGPDLESRGVGRALSVLVGAVAGSVVVALEPAPWVIGLAVVVALAALAGTAGSRWYVAPAFTTFVIFLMLLWDHPSDTAWRFAQRNLETVAGVGIALLFGVAVPLVTRRARSAA